MTIIKGNYRFESIADKPSTTEVQRQYFSKLYTTIQQKHTQYLLIHLTKRMLLD